MFSAYINGEVGSWHNEKNFIGFLDLMFGVDRGEIRRLKAGEEVSLWCHTVDESSFSYPKPRNSTKYKVKQKDVITAEFHFGLPILNS